MWRQDGGQYPNDVTVYVVKINGEEPSRWRFTSKEVMVRADDDGFCGTLEEVRGQIAAKEQVHVSMVQDGGAHYGLMLQATSECLEEALERVKKTGSSLNANVHMSLDWLKMHLKGRKIEKIGYDGFAVDDQWIVGREIKYAPHDIPELRKKWLEYLEASEKTSRAVNKRQPKTKIPNDSVLSLMFHALYNALLKLRPFTTQLRRGKYVTINVAHIGWARSRYERWVAMPQLVKLYHQISKSRAYRTKDWIRSVKVIISQFEDDILMKGQFKKLVWEEYLECLKKKRKKSS